MADPQRLNSLDRFRKQPGRLVLEEHSHCEVPAGCGGVVLRWRNPLAALHVTVRLYAPVQAVCFLDGQELQTGRIDLVPGPHVVAVVLEHVERDLIGGLLMFAATYDPKEYQRHLPAEVEEAPLTVLSESDGTWKFTLDPPPDDWTALAFDDRDWPALIRTSTPRHKSGDFGAGQLYYCEKAGATCLKLPEPEVGQIPWWRKLLGARPGKRMPPGPGNLWIRKTFEIPVPRLRAAQP
jgi:hypothetical protein